MIFTKTTVVSTCCGAAVDIVRGVPRIKICSECREQCLTRNVIEEGEAPDSKWIEESYPSATNGPVWTGD